jgi:uncharacterized protein
VDAAAQPRGAGQPGGSDRSPEGGPRTVRLRAPRERVDRRAVGWWTVQALVLWVPAVAVLVVLALLIGPARRWLLLAAVVAAVAGLLDTLVVPRWRYRVHRWEVTRDAVYTRSGWLNQEWRIAPMSRIQTVDTKRGPLQQLFGLSSVTVTTASAAGPVEIAGLDHERAAELAVQLTETTQATPGDAT